MLKLAFPLLSLLLPYVAIAENPNHPLDSTHTTASGSVLFCYADFGEGVVDLSSYCQGSFDLSLEVATYNAILCQSEDASNPDYAAASMGAYEAHFLKTGKVFPANKIDELMEQVFSFVSECP